MPDRPTAPFVVAPPLSSAGVHSPFFFSTSTESPDVFVFQL